jgi:hypothetical protein
LRGSDQELGQNVLFGRPLKVPQFGENDPSSDSCLSKGRRVAHALLFMYVPPLWFSRWLFIPPGLFASRWKGKVDEA